MEIDEKVIEERIKLLNRPIIFVRFIDNDPGRRRRNRGCPRHSGERSLKLSLYLSGLRMRLNDSLIEGVIVLDELLEDLLEGLGRWGLVHHAS